MQALRPVIGRSHHVRRNGAELVAREILGEQEDALHEPDAGLETGTGIVCENLPHKEIRALVHLLHPRIRMVPRRHANDR